MYRFKFNEEDLRIMKEIGEFLTSNGVDFSNTEVGVFELKFADPEKRSYEICYAPAYQFPVAYPKYDIEGIKADFFYKRSKAAEDSNSFKCWVKDYEWRDERKREVLKSYFLHAAGKTPNQFFARDCEVQLIGTREARDFESVNCFYGKRGASLNLGLVLKKDKFGIPAGTLVMVYTFGLNFFGQDGSIEVLRVGTLRFSQVIGGSSKLVKYFLRNFMSMRVGKRDIPVEILKFYSDYDHNIGRSMHGLGFEFVNYSCGGFMNYWLESGEVKGRQPSKHKQIMEQMSKGEVLSIPNAGVKTFVLHVTDEMRRLDLEVKEPKLYVPVNKIEFGITTQNARDKSKPPIHIKPKELPSITSDSW